MLTLTFLGDMAILLKKQYRSNSTVEYQLNRRASIKDIVESLGIPHTEVGKIYLRNEEISFEYIPMGDEQIHIHPFSPDQPVTEPSLLRPWPLRDIRFAVDINVGKLARLLRIAGIDASFVFDGRMKDIADSAVNEGRIVLTRNRDLLKHSVITFGRLLRSQNPQLQFKEVFTLYNLTQLLHPFSRCLECNGELIYVEKEQIIDRIEPLTIKYYNAFKQCSQCKRLYWRGSHHEKMMVFLRNILKFP